MPRHVKARAAQEEQEERTVHKLAKSHDAPADWKFHAQMVVESWVGKTPVRLRPIWNAILKRFVFIWHGSTRRASLAWE